MASVLTAFETLQEYSLFLFSPGAAKEVGLRPLRQPLPQPLQKKGPHCPSFCVGRGALPPPRKGAFPRNSRPAQNAPPCLAHSKAALRSRRRFGTAPHNATCRCGGQKRMGDAAAARSAQAETCVGPPGRMRRRRRFFQTPPALALLGGAESLWKSISVPSDTKVLISAAGYGMLDKHQPIGLRRQPRAARNPLRAPVFPSPAKFPINRRFHNFIVSFGFNIPPAHPSKI